MKIGDDVRYMLRAYNALFTGEMTATEFLRNHEADYWRFALHGDEWMEVPEDLEDWREEIAFFARIDKETFGKTFTGPEDQLEIALAHGFLTPDQVEHEFRKIAEEMGFEEMMAKHLGTT